MYKVDLKHTIRELKVLELVIRFGYSYDYVKKNRSVMQTKLDSLIWNDFFDLREQKDAIRKTRYSLGELNKMDKDSLKQVINEFWYYVYYQLYQEKGMPMFEKVSPDLLAYLELPFDADGFLVKKRFRELCKKYHPDAGGNVDKFIDLMEMSEKYIVK